MGTLRHRARQAAAYLEPDQKHRRGGADRRGREVSRRTALRAPPLDPIKRTSPLSNDKNPCT
jgi:hypothetical protein